MAFAIASFQFEVIAETTIQLPEFSGSTFRGGFGNAFKRTVCIYKPPECEKCPYREKCAYLYVFETPVTQIPDVLIPQGHAPHPFVLEPVYPAKALYEPGDTFTLGLHLFGKGMEYLPFFIFTFVRLGRMGVGKERGKFSVKRVWSVNGDKRLVYSGEDDTLRKSYHVFVWEGPPAEPPKISGLDTFALRFVTPTRIQSDGKYVRSIPFDLLLTNLLRRVKLIDLVHGDGTMAHDHQQWIEKAKLVLTVRENLFWNDWKRYSHRQGRKIFMGGVEGQVIYDGQLALFRELLEIGQKIHIGKGTSFGMGKFVLEE